MNKPFVSVEHFVKSLTPGSAKVYAALVENQEGCTSTHANGEVWRTVCLSNAQYDVEPSISKHAFAAHLGHLKDAGLYQDSGEGFGTVRTA